MEAPAHWSVIEREDFEERAALKEFLGNLPRERAEKEAMREIEDRRKKERKNGNTPKL